MSTPLYASAASELQSHYGSFNSVVQARLETTPSPDFNYVFLVYLIVAGVVAVLFILYLNRIFGHLVAYLIRTYTWHKFRIYIEIQALQISLLGGRIFVSGVRYHGENESFYIQQGYFTWCYWLRNVRNPGLLNTASRDAEGHETHASKALPPCRFAANLVGVEWFVYNRTAVYESIFDALTKDIPSQPSRNSSFEVHDASSIRQRATRVSRETSSEESKAARSNTLDTSASRRAEPQTSRTTAGRDSQPDESEIPMMLRIFPIHLEVTKVALVMGNENTKAVLVVKADDLSGDIDAVATETPDPYRQVFNLRFKHPVVEMRHNADFREEQATRAVRERKNAQLLDHPAPGWFASHLPSHWMGNLREMVPGWTRSNTSLGTAGHTPVSTEGSQTPGASLWQGLSRYLDDQSQDDKARWAHVEYAAEPVIIDSPLALMSVYWDSPTTVPELPDPALRSKEDPFATNINGEMPPAWGIDLTIKGGVVNYGPWADRCRAELQKVFFPGLCKDSVPTPAIPSGELRMSTQFKMYIQLDEDVTVRILTREDSKNWKWKGKAPAVAREAKRKRRDKKRAMAEPVQARQAGWLELKVAPGSSVSYVADSYAGPRGFAAAVHVDFPGTEMSSSVNHQVLLRSGAFRIACDLGTPLQWNALRTWNFDVSSEDMSLFLLRDHVFLLTDLIDDWGSGPLTEYLMFTPFKYLVNLDLQRFKLHLNVNDANVVDNATSADENMFLVLGSPVLITSLTIPLDQFRPSKNAIPFKVRMTPLNISYHLPPWNTQAAFLPSNDIGTAESLDISGKYEYNATTAAFNTDTLVLDVAVGSPVVKLFGTIIRALLKLKDNYLGDDIHFRTIEEYQDMLQLQKQNPAAETTNKAPYKKTNDMDVMMTVRVDDPRIFLPGNLYSAGRFTLIEMASITADARFTNYYMDLELILAPISLSLGAFQQESDMATASSTAPQLFIDGIRVFGNRLFGLPPTEPTYMCNWDLSVGALTGECTAEFLAALALGGRAFDFMFDDEENALVSFSSIVCYDVTFLRLSLDTVKLWVKVDEAAFLFSTGVIDVDFNDWARSHYSKKANIVVPDVQIACISTDDAGPGRSSKHFNSSVGGSGGGSGSGKAQIPADADVMISTSIRIAMIGRKFHFTQERKTQQELLRREDQRTHRTPFLLFPEYAGEYVPDAVDPVAQAVPPVPHPISNGSFLVGDGASSLRTGRSATSASSFSSSRRSGGTLRSRMTRKTGGTGTGTGTRAGTLRRQSSFLSFSSAVSTQRSVVRPSSSERSGSYSHSHSHSQSRSLSHSVSHGERWRDAGRRSSTYTEIAQGLPPDAPPSAVASQYLAPQFSLANVVPQSRDAAAMVAEMDADWADFMEGDFPLEDIDPNSLSEDHLHTSFVVEFPVGITGVFTPVAIRNTTKLLSALQPSSPDDILDSLQLSSMTDLLSLKKQATIHGTIVDVLVTLPSAHLRFLNSSALAGSPETQLDEKDQYDMHVSKLALALRSSKTRATDTLRPADAQLERTSFRASFGRLAFSASERLHDGGENQAAVQAEVEDATVSMGSRDITSVNVNVRNIGCSTSSSQIQYMASLIHRTAVLARYLEGLLTETVDSHKDRVKVFVEQLLAHGQHTPDPPYIVRPSAVLRSVESHLRKHDSWKLVHRLRHIWSKMEQLTRHELLVTCLETHPRPSADVEKLVLAAFTKWRGWDLEGLHKAVLLKNIFGSHVADAGADGTNSAAIDQELPLLVTCQLGQLELVLDPGPKQNVASLMGLAIKVKSNDARGAPDAGVAEQKHLTVVNVHCREAALKVNWELCELADDVLALYNKTAEAQATEAVNQPKTQPQTQPQAKQAQAKQAQANQSIHVAIAAGKSSLEIDTINLHSKAYCSGFNGSVLVHLLPGNIHTTNVVFSSDAVAANLFSHTQELGMFRLLEPSLFAAHELREDAVLNLASHVVKCAPSSKSMRLRVKQDPLALLEVADLLIRDEFAQLYRLKGRIARSSEVSAAPKPKPVPPSKKKIAERLSTLKVNVAMFLNDYDISLPLSQNLTYNIQGVVARAAVATNYGKELIFDFDIKENAHSIGVGYGASAYDISLLEVPPTNGRVRSVIGPTEHAISVATTLEMVRLDAAAVYSLLTALNRPQLSAEMEDVQDMLKVLQEHFQDVVDYEGGASEALAAPLVPTATTATAPTTATTPDADPSLPLVYRVHVALAGLRVFGKTSLKSDSDPLAYVEFRLDKVRFEATNHFGPGQPLLENPHVNLNLSQVSFELCKGHDAAMRLCGSLAFGALLSLSSTPGGGGEERALSFQTNALEIMLSPETVSTAIDIMGHMGDKIKDLDTTRERRYLRRRLRQSRPPRASLGNISSDIGNNNNDNSSSNIGSSNDNDHDIIDSVLGSCVYHVQIRNISVCWLVSEAREVIAGQEDLVLTVELIELSTRQSKSARLEIQNLQLQMVPIDEPKTAARSSHSALLPEIIFNVAAFSSGSTRRLAFQAVGKSVDVRLTSGFMIPATYLQDSITRSLENVQRASENWSRLAAATAAATAADAAADGSMTPTSGATSSAASFSDAQSQQVPAAPATPGLLGSKRFESLLVHVEFAGAMLHLSGRRNAAQPKLRSGRTLAGGKYGQFKMDETNVSAAALRTPGLAWRVEYRDNGTDNPSLNGEIRVESSSNTLHPTVVPLIMDISASLKEVVNEKKARREKLDTATQAKKRRPRVSESSSWLGSVVSDRDRDGDKQRAREAEKQKSREEENQRDGDKQKDKETDPSLILGRLNLNIGLRIAKQEFALSCQPIARVAATGCFDSIYVAINTVHSAELGNFLAMTATFSKLRASVQHVYSRESTASFAVESIVLSLMNNKHFSGTTGLSALLKVSPMQVVVNARQMQDFLLFGEIWYPKEMRSRTDGPATESPAESPTEKDATQQQQQQLHLVQRYHQVAATAAFPWTATISIQSLDVSLDMGQSVGKSIFAIKHFWVSSKKTSDWEQNMCLGFERIGMDSTGRMSGFVALRQFKLRTSIQWPKRHADADAEHALTTTTPTVHASISFDQFSLKAAWDYQAFAAVDITSLDFFMYNVRGSDGNGNRLVAIVDCDAVQAFGTTASVAQGVSLYRAILKFIQERKAGFQTSLQEIERFTKRRSMSNALALSAAAATSSTAPPTSPSTPKSPASESNTDTNAAPRAPISLATDVIVTLKAVNMGVFPSSFTDHQVFKIEALNAQARFSAAVEPAPSSSARCVHSILDLTLGQLRVGLAAVRSEPPKNSSDLSVQEVIERSTGSRGGTILKVPRVHAMMETWQAHASNTIDYIFSSVFEGKVEVGWNYSRISYIRGMWASHVQSLEPIWGKDLPLTLPGTIKVTEVPGEPSPVSPASAGASAEPKAIITTEVRVPQSKYEYRALREPIIQTPQLKDMGEATPPLEWIGLHREKLPNLTHQILIITLLELAGEVEDVYARILGST